MESFVVLLQELMSLKRDFPLLWHAFDYGRSGEGDRRIQVLLLVIHFEDTGSKIVGFEKPVRANQG